MAHPLGTHQGPVGIPVVHIEAAARTPIAIPCHSCTCAAVPSTSQVSACRQRRCSHGGWVLLQPGGGGQWGQAAGARGNADATRSVQACHEAIVAGLASLI